MIQIEIQIIRYVSLLAEQAGNEKPRIELLFHLISFINLKKDLFFIFAVNLIKKNKNVFGINKILNL
jgi:hypothetical protein